MNIKSRIKEFALQRGVLMQKVAPKAALESFLSRFRENLVSLELVRIGGEGDGGYLLPPILDSIDYCFSPGVDYTATFEGELSSKYGIISFMADASVSSAPFEDENFRFTKKFLGSRTGGDYITLGDWLSNSIGSTPCNMVLQMDIEGGEYDVLTFESADTLARFSAMMIEFHGLDGVFETQFLRTLASIFEKIYKNFSICHVHPNNCCGVARSQGIDVPRVMEVSFIRKDLVDDFRCDSKFNLPHKLDRKNVKEREDFIMPAIWWA